MKRFYARLRARSTERLLRSTSFCEECGQVCTATCRRDRQLERARMGDGITGQLFI